MENNDVLRRLRYALDLSDTHMLDLFARAGEPPPRDVFLRMLGDPEADDYVSLTDRGLAQLLDGLIHERRGPRDPSRPPVASGRMDNNQVLRKLRIAFTFQEQDMLRLLDRGGMKLSSSELSALFRKPGHRHYRPAGDQLTRAFLVGLAEELRT